MSVLKQVQRIVWQTAQTKKLQQQIGIALTPTIPRELFFKIVYRGIVLIESTQKESFLSHKHT